MSHINLKQPDIRHIAGYWFSRQVKWTIWKTC